MGRVATSSTEDGTSSNSLLNLFKVISMTQINKTFSGPLFSIVTVTYNDLRGLILTYESIELQTYKNFEWVIVDGASNDGTVDYLKSVKGSVATLISEKDSGIYDAMNKGILKCTGQYIVFMNAGDVFSDAFVLQKVSNLILSNSKLYDVIFGGATLKFPNGSSLFRPARKLESYIWNGLPAIHQATYYLREKILNILYDLKYRICGDYYIIAALYRQGVSSVYLDSSLVDFRVGDTSYRNPTTVLIEGYRIQRDILNSPFRIRMKSIIRRLVSFIGWVFLSQRFYSWFLRLKSKRILLQYL